MASKPAYSTPLTVSLAKEIGVLLHIRAASLPTADLAGTKARNPLAPTPGLIVKRSVWPLQATIANVEPLRASSHSSIWRAEMTGTCRACADATIASESSEELAQYLKGSSV